jgi:hypothetical protein
MVLITAERGENGGSYLSIFRDTNAKSKIKAFQVGAAALCETH